jgi:hypothetical protein
MTTDYYISPEEQYSIGIHDTSCKYVHTTNMTLLSLGAVVHYSGLCKQSGI